MGKDTHKKRENQVSKNSKFSEPLDKLAQLGTRDKKSLKSKAKSKFLATKISVGLGNIEGSILNKSYWNSYWCNRTLLATEGSVTSQYCNARWCLVCNRIRMAKMINGYITPLGKLSDKYFVTLTVPNCDASLLGVTIRKMLNCFKQITETMKKRKQRGDKDYQIVGIRKLECTYNEHTDTYHPHFHLIVSGENCASDIVKEWLHRNPKCTIKAQDYRKANEGSIIELFKYFAKIVSKVNGCYTIHLKSLDVIFCSMLGLRVFQPIGIKKVTEDVEGLISEYIGIEDGVWTWYESDWYDEEGVALTCYVPSENIKKLSDSIKKAV